MPEQITGVIERITFHNLDTGYCVLRVSVRGQRDPVTVVGHTQQVVAGEYVQAAGTWVNDRTHGLQFKADEVKTTPPHTAEGIAKYLGSGLVKGVGPGYAKRIVEVFGERTLEVIDRSPTFLSQVKGIGPKLIEKIRTSWQEQVHVRHIMVFLHSQGIGTARAVKIYRTYGENAIETIKANPYRLSADIWGIGFHTADAIARNLGLPHDSPKRAMAAVRYVLQEASGNGHVGFPEPLVMTNTEELTQIAPVVIQDAVEQLRIEDEIVRDSPRKAGGTQPNPPTPFPKREGGAGGRKTSEDDGVSDPSFSPPFSGEGQGERLLATDDTLLYLKPLFLAELGVARQVRALAGGPHPLPVADLDGAITWAERKMQISFAKTQREAVRAAVSKKFMVVTGGPGTGKTTIVRAILDIFQAKALRLSLCAPTGRAAKRLTESTGREAKTVHRLLEFDAGINDFRRNKENPLDTDLIVVDETSMVDVVLMNKLLRAVPPWACVVLVGDVDQLPSVGAGSVLRDLIDSGIVPVARLTEVHRQAEASHIVRAAHAINNGEEPESAPPGQGDFYFVEANDPPAVIDRIRQMVCDRIPAKFGLDPFRDVQVLSPMNKSELGVRNLNAELQKALNPGGAGAAEVQRFGTTYRVRDKVMQTRNNYTREVFNGDIGRITAIDPEDQTVLAEFDGREVVYDYADLDELVLAYAVSIHKSQGSEYPAVVIPVHTQHFVMLQRNLLYTGITRGRKLVALVGSKKALWIAVRNQDTAKRFSLLMWRLQNGETPAALR